MGVSHAQIQLSIANGSKTIARQPSVCVGGGASTASTSPSAGESLVLVPTKCHKLLKKYDIQRLVYSDTVEVSFFFKNLPYINN